MKQKKAPTQKKSTLNKPTIQKQKISQSNVRLLRELDQEKKVVAVIVTFVNGSSYDHLFTSV